MHRHPVRIALMVALGLGGQAAWALGLGAASTQAHLGRPLDFTVALRLDAHETFDATCVVADVTAGDRPLSRHAVRARAERFDRDGRGDTAAERATAGGAWRVRVQTTVNIDEPVVSIQLGLGCPPALTQHFVLFADPPGSLPMVAPAPLPLSDVSASDSSGGGSPGPVRRSAGAVRAAAAGSATPTPSGRRSGVRSAPRAAGSMAAPLARADVARTATDVPAGTPRAQARQAPSAHAAVAPRRTGGPVLQLDPIETDALVVPELAMSTQLSTHLSTPLSAPHAAASGMTPRVVDPELAAQQQAQARLKALEGSVEALRQDSAAKQKSLLALQARLHEAEGSRYANALVYGLMLLSGLLALAVLVMLWLRHRDRKIADGWAALAQQQLTTEVPVAPVLAADGRPLEESTLAAQIAAQLTSQLTSQADSTAPLSATVEPPQPSMMAEPGPAIEAQASAAPVPGAAPEPRRPMSAEELIDLEQQVDFFVVLGQDDAAIDLLMSHVRSTGGVSPLPYLKLLEIYRRRNEPEPYERIRERFNRRFNAYTPEWGLDPEAGRALEDYPEVVARLQATWPMPAEALALLDHLLFRRDAGPTFDVPAYRQLLFLYGTARDLAERDVPATGVDLLLPDFEESDFSHAVLLPHDAHAPLDLDVSTDRPPLSTIEPLQPNPRPTALAFDFSLNENPVDASKG